MLCINGNANCNKKNNNNWTPLQTAAKNGQEKGIQEVLKLNLKLRDRGLEMFDINSAGGAHQWSTLHLAAHYG